MQVFIVIDVKIEHSTSLITWLIHTLILRRAVRAMYNLGLRKF